jgi:multidrug resistance efflux pump
MSEHNPRPELDADRGEVDASQFDEEALRARRRQYKLAAAAIVIVVAATLAVPWRDHVKAGGRIAPQRWARVHSEAPGVVREVTHTSGDPIEEGEVIAVLDYDEQRDALEAARLVLAREREKLADLELRLRENAIQREGADAVAKLAGERALAAERIDGSRLAALDPLADAALEGVRAFSNEARAEVAKNRGDGHPQSVFRGAELSRDARSDMARYSERAGAVADQLTRLAGPEAGRQFRFELEDLRFAYDLADHSMAEILMKQELVQRGFLAPVALREPCIELEREAMQLAQSFRALSGGARALLGSPAEQSERVRSAEESQRLLFSESGRLEAERASVSSDIAAAEIAVRAAERHQGKTAIRAPIRGTLAGESLARFDPVSANASVGTIEDASRLVLKVQVDGTDFRRVKVGQSVESRARDGRPLRGSVFWRTPVRGQEVRDQAWNVLIQLEGDNSGVSLGEKVMASIDVGRRSLLGRWLEPANSTATEPRVAFVEDPTELRKQPGEPRESVAAVPEQLSPPERRTVRNGTDGG